MDPVTLAGLEARYYVRSALHRDWADPDWRDALARAFTAFGYPTLGAAVLAGWTHRDTTPTIPPVWHRQFGTTRVLIGAA